MKRASASILVTLTFLATVVAACSRSSSSGPGLRQELENSAHNGNDAIQRPGTPPPRVVNPPPPLSPPPGYACALDPYGGVMQCSRVVGDDTPSTPNTLVFLCTAAGTGCTAKGPNLIYTCPDGQPTWHTSIVCQSGTARAVTLVFDGVAAKFPCSSDAQCVAKASGLLGPDAGPNVAPRCCSPGGVSACVLPAFGCDSGFRFMTYDGDNAPYAGFGNCIAAPVCSP
jgi:hypothetical protein